MKLLVISTPGGSGHVQAAKALVAAALHDKDITETKYIHTDSFFSHVKSISSIFRSYDYSTRHTPYIWGFIYAVTNNALARLCNYYFFTPLFRYIHKKEVADLNRAIAEFAPDWIICTHTAGRMMFTYTKCRIGTIITDHGLHTLWIYNPKEFYFVPNKEMKEQLLQHGVHQHTCIVSGIPVHPLFF